MQSSGNMRVPSVLNMLMCLEDVVFNLLLIFPTGTIAAAGQTIVLLGAGFVFSGDVFKKALLIAVPVGFEQMMMSVAAVLIYAGAPLMIGLLSPDAAIRTLGAAVLRIEAFAEPLYGASLGASGVFRGAGDTLVPSGMNFLTMWCVRLPLAAYLAPRLGLSGVWIAMCTELCVRGAVFLLRLARGRWL